MRHFLYDEANKRLVLTDGLWPSVELEKANRIITPNSNQARLYNSLYIWENVKLVSPNEKYLDKHVWQIKVNYEVWSLSDGGGRVKVIMEIPYADAYVMYGGAYQYNEPKKPA